jgi:hypothetical protein
MLYQCQNQPDFGIGSINLSSPLPFGNGNFPANEILVQTIQPISDNCLIVNLLSEKGKRNIPTLRNIPPLTNLSI